jgi:hypothetical protein
MICSMRLDGSTACMTIEGATDAEVFRAYVRRVLCPTLRKGDVVIMDNLSPHKSELTCPATVIFPHLATLITLLHFLCSQRLAPSRGSLLRQILEWAPGSLQRLERREDLVSNSRHKAVLPFRHEDELFVFVNSNEQGVEPMRTGDVTANDELLLSVGAVLDPRA